MYKQHFGCKNVGASAFSGIAQLFFSPYLGFFLYKQHSVLSKLRVGHVFVVLQKRIPKTANAKA